MTTYVNLTPHNITLRNGKCHYETATHHWVVDKLYEGEYMEAIIPSEGVASVSRSTEEVPCENFLEGDFRVPHYRVKFGEIIGLPEPKQGVIYIVSSLVFQAAIKIGRTDVACTDRVIYGPNHEVLFAMGLSVA